MERRFADQAPVWPIAHAAGLQNMRAIWEDAAIKRKMDRLLNARALGVEDVLKDGNDEMPGDISIKGDETHTHYHAPPVVQPVTTQTAAQPATTTIAQPLAQSGLRRWLLPAVACIGMPMLGVGGAMLYQYFSKAPAAVQASNNLGIKPGVQVTDKP